MIKIILATIFVISAAQSGAALDCYKCLASSNAPDPNSTIYQAIFPSQYDHEPPELCYDGIGPLPTTTCNDKIGENKCIYIGLIYEDQWSKIRSCGLDVINYCELEYPGGIMADKCYECKDDLCNENPDPSA